MASNTLPAQRLGVRSDRLDLGGKLVTLAGVAVLVYGLIFLVLNFTAFIEVGLSRGLVGGDAASISAFSPGLYRYVSHLQVNIAGFITGAGLMIACLGWYGIRSGLRWAIATACGSYLLMLAINLPIHYAYGLAALVHVGPFYLVTLLVVVGSALAWSGLPATPSGAEAGPAGVA